MREGSDGREGGKSEVGESDGGGRGRVREERGGGE